MLPCGHDGDICSDCVLRHASTQIRSNRSPRVKCMLTDCTAVYTAENIRAHGGQELASEMESLQSRWAIEQMPNFRWCLRSGCGSGQIHDDEEGNSVIMKCVECGTRTCTYHGVEWHEGMTCKQYDRKLSWLRFLWKVLRLLRLEWTVDWGNLNLAVALRDMDIKPCPKCGQGVQKNGGCDHVSWFYSNIYICFSIYSCRETFCFIHFLNIVSISNIDIDI